jgi:hypothetical protein
MEEANMYLSEFRTVISLPHEAPNAIIRTNPFPNSYNETSGGYHDNWMEGVNEKTARLERFRMGNILFWALQLTPMHLVATSH